MVRVSTMEEMDGFGLAQFMSKLVRRDRKNGLS
jgi:hypothetical protein